MNNNYYKEVVSKKDRSAERSMSGSRVIGSYRPKSSHRQGSLVPTTSPFVQEVDLKADLDE
jgi:hypothetical protein